MKKILMGFLILSMLAIPVFAGKSSVAEFDYWQEYSGWGPALYYGEDVNIHYEATNRWVLNKEEMGENDWYIEQSLTQRGTAWIYNLDENLLDKRNFRVVEITKGYVDKEQDWYHVRDVDTLEEWNYHWKIPGVYHFFGHYPNEDENLVYEVLQPEHSTLYEGPIF
ncbi:MAG: hypothetical protein GF368_05180 [Candidatus Aenigmarchaeota archaeon]|nr:hypothetical protein [Candidatus Aenigmarchaeota archaeon]